MSEFNDGPHQNLIEEEPEQQVSLIYFHAHDQLFEIPNAIQLADYLTLGSVWHNCVNDLISIQFKTGQRAKITDYIIGPNDS